MSNKPFQFKQFTVHQDRCAMKIGTDGVLLGSWVPLNDQVSSVLDIGTGTGIIAMMMAQRSEAELIDAIEIDENAYEQAVENFENSPWGDRLFCYHASFQEFVQEFDDVYDLIVSNPPFYTDDYKSKKQSRDRARFEDSLPFQHLVIGSAHLLSDDGKLAMIVPFKEESYIIDIARNTSLFPHKVTRIKGTPDSEIKRSMLLFGFERIPVETNLLIIENSRHQYTEEYISLTKEFYLKM